jgi:fluoride exporter
MNPALLKIGLIAIGGAGGSVLRYWMQSTLQRATGGTFPVGTLVVNILGCLAIGFLNRALTGAWLIREEYRIALTVGVLGGFTTFSAFGWESFTLANDGQFPRAAANIVLSVTLGLIAVWIGYRLAERWVA